MADKRDYYEVLGLSKGASEDDIKREIMVNGPVVGTMEIYTDFLNYKKGVKIWRKKAHLNFELF